MSHVPSPGKINDSVLGVGEMGIGSGTARCQHRVFCVTKDVRRVETYSGNVRPHIFNKAHQFERSHVPVCFQIDPASILAKNWPQISDKVCRVGELLCPANGMFVPFHPVSEGRVKLMPPYFRSDFDLLRQFRDVFSQVSRDDVRIAAWHRDMAIEPPTVRLATDFMQPGCVKLLAEASESSKLRPVKSAFDQVVKGREGIEFQFSNGERVHTYAHGFTPRSRGNASLVVCSLVIRRAQG